MKWDARKDGMENWDSSVKKSDPIADFDDDGGGVGGVDLIPLPMGGTTSIVPANGEAASRHHVEPPVALHSTKAMDTQSGDNTLR